jgi:predicted adenylyl cyclase CyaB
MHHFNDTLMSRSYEVEIKSLLGSKENALALIANLKKTFPNTKLIGKGNQFNHYFNVPKDLSALKEKTKNYIPESKHAEYDYMLSHGSKMSIRTRDADGKIILVVKASVGSDTSSNGVKRIEFEEKVPLSLAEVDQLLLDSGCTYQAKWSREREEYQSSDMHVCIDKNAGYGYLAEFEKVIENETLLDIARLELENTMKSLGVNELPQDRLERMFSFYNSHWGEYYGTDKTFTVQ